MRILFLFSLCPLILFAQQEDQQANDDVSKRHYVALNLLSPLNDLSPRWRIGYIRKIDPRWQMAIDIGYGNKNVAFKTLNHNLSYQNGYELWEVRPEIQYSVFNRYKLDVYVAVGIFYIHHKDILTNKSYLPKGSSEYYDFDKANFLRRKYGLHVLSGIWLRKGKPISFNFYVGLGIRCRNQKFSKVSNASVSTGKFGDFASFVEDSGYLIVEGSTTGLDFILGSRIALSLTKS